MTDRMTKAERDDLVRLVKQREKVAKTAAEQRSAAMLAEFERQVSDSHNFNRNEVWKAAVDAAVEAAREANAKVAVEAERLGIPEEFRPSLSYSWNRRGEAEYTARREELRRVAKAEIETLEKAARVQIEAQSVQAQTEIIANGLSSTAAIEFLNNLPKIEAMMPPLDVSEIQAKLAARARQGGHRPYLIGQDQ
jgi:hypothetical protein